MHLSFETALTTLVCSIRVWVAVFKGIRAALHQGDREHEVTRCIKRVSTGSRHWHTATNGWVGPGAPGRIYETLRRVAAVYLAASSWISAGSALPLPLQSLSILDPGLQSCWQIFIFKAALHKSVFKRFWVEDRQQRKKVPLVFYLSSKMRRLWCIRQSQRSSEW